MAVMTPPGTLARVPWRLGHGSSWRVDALMGRDRDDAPPAEDAEGRILGEQAPVHGQRRGEFEVIAAGARAHLDQECVCESDHERKRSRGGCVATSTARMVLCVP